MIDLAVVTWVDFAGGKEISQYNFPRVTSCVPLPQERGNPDLVGGSCGILALPPYSGRGAPSSPPQCPGLCGLPPPRGSRWNNTEAHRKALRPSPDLPAPLSSSR